MESKVFLCYQGKLGAPLLLLLFLGRFCYRCCPDIPFLGGLFDDAGLRHSGVDVQGVRGGEK